MTVKRNATLPDAVHECGLRNTEGVLFEGLTNPVNGESEYGGMNDIL